MFYDCFETLSIRNASKWIAIMPPQTFPVQVDK